MSPRTEEQNAALREESYTRILHAGLALFSLHGYDRTTVKMIAEEAGVAQGLLYRHFANKDDLLRAIFARSVADVLESFALAAEGRTTPPTPAAIIRSAFVLIRQKREFWRLSYGSRMQQAVLDVLGGDVLAWSDTIRGTLEAALRASGVPEPAVQARLLFAAIDGVAQHYVLEPDTYPLDAVTEALVARFDAHEGVM